ncbi:uncharacterized protein [Apostichopus japonicus]|uniref:uncharacterized protein n=1 Tax=Stichopus japonicus TaxID=307972 RepID=UPI003AB24338
MEGAQTKSNGPLMQGFLSRRIMGGSMKSKKKWFVLTGRRLLSFKSEQAFKNDNVFIDCFDLMQLQAVRALTSQGHAKNAFEIVTMNKSIVFQSPSQEQSLQWLDALKEVMMQRFSDTAELPEKEEETKKIEDELQRRKSNLKFWRNSSQSSSRHFSDEEDAINSFDFLANQEKQEEEEGDVFNDGDHDQDLADHMVDARPISASSGVDSTSVDESPDYDVPATHAHSEDEGISETTGEPNSDETNDPMYENFRQPEKLRRKSSPAIEELKELVHFEEKVNDDDTGTAEVKGIEELRALLASMP